MNELTNAQVKFLEIADKYEQLKEEMKKIKPELYRLLGEIGVGTYFQDPDDDVVYKITVPKGTFIEFPPIGYDRTKRDYEKTASLSKKEAELQGFKL
jgi:hypothetical protein